MIKNLPNADFKYFAQYRYNLNIFLDYEQKVNLANQEFLDQFFREKLHITTEQKLDFKSAQIQLLSLLLDDHKIAICRSLWMKGLIDNAEPICSECIKRPEKE